MGSSWQGADYEKTKTIFNFIAFELKSLKSQFVKIDDSDNLSSCGEGLDAEKKRESEGQ